MKELPLVSLFCSCFLADPLNKSSYKYEGTLGSRLGKEWEEGSCGWGTPAPCAFPAHVTIGGFPEPIKSLPVTPRV